MKWYEPILAELRTSCERKNEQFDLIRRIDAAILKSEHSSDAAIWLFTTFDSEHRTILSSESIRF